MLTKMETPLTLEEYYERGRLALQDMDRGRWTIGDDALEIKTRWRGFDIQTYAKHVNIAPERVLEYRTVCKFYTFSARAEFLEDHPMITYTHMRDAMRLKDPFAAYAFLEEANDNAWTVNQARIELIKKLGKPVPPVRETFEGTVRQAGNGAVLLNMDSLDSDKVRALVMLYRDTPDWSAKLVISYAMPPEQDGN